MKPKPVFQLRFAHREIPGLARAYVNGDRRAVDLPAISRAVRRRGHYTKREFLAVCRWKSERTKKWCASNSADEVEIITRAALTSSDERVRIETLTMLNGVSWPTASVLLHFGHKDPYPILDYRALWAVGIDPPPPYGFEFWRDYMRFCRRLADRAEVPIRTLDQALWQYSTWHQPRQTKRGEED